MKKAVIVIPTYNEAGNIKKLMADVFDHVKTIPNWEIEILFVDSNSEDGTGDIIRELQQTNKKIHLLSTPKEGLGKAYIKGFQYAIEKLNAYLLFEMDADLSHDHSQIADFIKKIEKGADFVIGSRYIKGGSIPKEWGWHRKVFSYCGNLIIRAGFMKLKIHDWTDGYRAIKSWLIKDSMSHIRHYSGYVFQIALLDYAVKHHANIVEIPTSFKERSYGRSKINAIQYILNIIVYILRNSSFIKFVFVGGLGFFIDLGIFYYFTKYAHLLSWHANLISTETAVIANFFLNNFWSFKHKKIEHKASAYIFQFLKFNVISSGSIVIQTVGVELAKMAFGAHNIYLYKVLIIFFIVIPYSYIFYNKFVWKEKK